MNNKDQDQAADILIHEVDEDLRREQYLKLWRAYGKYAIAAIAAIILGVAGHQAWLSWRDRQFQAEAAKYQAAEELTTAGKQNEALVKLAEIAGGKGGFAMAAGFRRAELQVESGDLAAAAASYDAISKSDAPAQFRDLATLKGAMLTLDKDDPEALAKRIQPITNAANPWHFTAIEMMAMLANRRGDKDQAIKYFKQLADDAQAPQGARSRASEMLTILGGGQAPEKG